jgi:hypothetical protein
MLLTLASVASAAGVTVDGKVNASEYTHHWSIAPSSAGPSNMDLYMWQDGSNNLYVAVVLPMDYTDNTYGSTVGTAGVAGSTVGTSKNWNDAGKSVHEFKSGLLDTDSIEGMALTLDGKSKLNIDVDFLDFKSPNYVSGGLGGDRGAVNSGDGSNVLAIETSMGYNFAQYGAAHPTWFGDGKQSPSSALAPDWQYSVAYEMKFDEALFGGIDLLSNQYSDALINGFSMSFVKIHSSPSMGGKFENRTPPNGTTPLPPGGPVVPLPSSVWMGGLTLAGLIVGRRLRRKTEI